MNPSVSIIIPTFNRPQFLFDLLDSMSNLESSGIHFEVLIIDNNSSEENKALITRSLQRFSFPIRLFIEKNPGLHNVRHRGLLESHGEIIIYLDDDIVVSKSWLMAAVKPFSQTENIIVFGRVLPKFLGQPPEWLNNFWTKLEEKGKYLGQLSLIDLGDEECQTNHFQFIPGCNLALRKKSLIELGGFHPDSMPSDLIRYRGDGETALCKKAFQQGFTFHYSPQMLVFHQIPNERMTEEYFCHRMFLQGISDSFTAMRENQKIPEHMELKMKHAYCQGRIFHCEQVMNDTDLYNWVMYKNFLPKQSDEH